MYSVWKCLTFGPCMNTQWHQHTTKTGYVFLGMRWMLLCLIKELAKVRLLNMPLFLSNLLGKVASAANITQAFEAYDTMQRSRSQRVVTISKEAGYLYKMEDEVGQSLHKARGNLAAWHKWIWWNDLKSQVKEPQDAMIRESKFRSSQTFSCYCLQADDSNTSVL